MVEQNRKIAEQIFCGGGGGWVRERKQPSVKCQVEAQDDKWICIQLQIIRAVFYFYFYFPLQTHLVMYPHGVNAFQFTGPVLRFVFWYVWAHRREERDILRAK